MYQTNEGKDIAGQWWDSKEVDSQDADSQDITAMKLVMLCESFTGCLLL